jgi:hypothetical protein
MVIRAGLVAVAETMLGRHLARTATLEDRPQWKLGIEMGYYRRQRPSASLADD